MPKKYEQMRDAMHHKGMNYDKAQSVAAATYRKMTGKGMKHDGHKAAPKRMMR